MKLSLRDAATLLTRSPRTLRDQAKRGTVPAHKVESRWVFLMADLPLDDRAQDRLQQRANRLCDALEEARPHA